MNLKIGIVCQDQPENRFGTHDNYMYFVYKFGIPIMIPPVDLQDFKEIFKLDALILPGGSDVNPGRYSEKPGFFTYNPNNYLEHFDREILPSLIGKIPIFGICRGLQTLNVLFGGTLKQHLWYHPYSISDEDAVHKIAIYFNGKETKQKLDVNSFHHQGIDKLASNFMIEAKSNDGVIEAISDREKRIFAVQWHPERLRDEYSIKAFQSILG